MTVTWSVNGVETTSEFTQEDALVLPEEPESCNEEMVFVGWSASRVTDGQKPADLFRFAGSKVVSEAITYYAVFAKYSGSDVSTIADTLTVKSTGATGSTYDKWQDVSLNSSAVYAGNSAGGNDAIQLRSRNSNSGIITTASGGTILKVQVEWDKEHTFDARVLDIYASKMPYSDVTEIYNTTKGTKIGSLVCGETELDILDDYQYVGIRSNNGALYLKSIIFTWSDSDVTFSDYTTSCEEGKGIEDAEIKTMFHKIIRDGQLIIIRDNEQYTILGQKIK